MPYTLTSERNTKTMVRASEAKTYDSHDADANPFYSCEIGASCSNRLITNTNGPAPPSIPGVEVQDEISFQASPWTSYDYHPAEGGNPVEQLSEDAQAVVYLTLAQGLDLNQENLHASLHTVLGPQRLVKRASPVWDELVEFGRQYR